MKNQGNMLNNTEKIKVDGHTLVLFTTGLVQQLGTPYID